MAFYVDKDLGQGTVTGKDYDLYCHYGNVDVLLCVRVCLCVYQSTCVYVFQSVCVCVRVFISCIRAYVLPLPLLL